MVTTRMSYPIALVLISLYLSGIGVAVLFNVGFGALTVEGVSIPNEGNRISGLLYHPVQASPVNPLPAVVLVHGISGSKQMLSGVALELARHGFISLTIDLVGHGNSEGVFGLGVDPTLGTLAAVRYLESQPFVKASSIGLVGHSLGAGAVRATAVAHGNIAASVYIGGGFGDVVAGSSYGTFNSSFPKNLLIIVGRQDVLFDLAQLKRDLRPIFGADQDVAPSILYGDFPNQTARKLITPATTHLFEPVDPSAVSEVVLWMSNALKPMSLGQRPPLEVNLTYFYREAAISISLVALIGLVFSITSALFNHYPALIQAGKQGKKYGSLEDWKVAVIWGVLSLALFLPMFFTGFLLPFPPLLFGSSFAWWLLAVAVLGLLSALFLLPKFSTVALNLRSTAAEAFNLPNAAIGITLFTLMFSIVNLTEAVSHIDLRVSAIPVFNDLRPMTRVHIFFSFIPFFLVYFFVEGLYLHEFHNWSSHKAGFRYEVSAGVKVVAVKIWPYLLTLLTQYAPMFSLNIRLFPSSIGFLIEFLWGVIPLFIISTASSWWFYRKASNIGAGTIFNSLIIAWSAAATFPIGAFG